MLPAIPARQEGRTRRHGRRGGMRWMRVVPPDERRVLRTAKPRGYGASQWKQCDTLSSGYNARLEPFRIFPALANGFSQQGAFEAPSTAVSALSQFSVNSCPGATDSHSDQFGLRLRAYRRTADRKFKLIGTVLAFRDDALHVLMAKC